MTSSREDVRKKQWRDLADAAARSGPIPIRCSICPAGPGKPCVNSVTLGRRDRPHITRVLAAGGAVPPAPPQLQEEQTP